MRLFKLARVECTFQRVPRAFASISLVAVLPFVPVTAITGPGTSLRRARASRPRATSGSSTSNCSIPSRCGDPRRTTAPVAPASRAASRKSCPSKCSPVNATNRAFRLSVRVSVLTSENDRSLSESVFRTAATLSPVQITTTLAHRARRARFHARQTVTARCRSLDRFRDPFLPARGNRRPRATRWPAVWPRGGW